jgi:YgiT-type zinc finger domain-containing protein
MERGFEKEKETMKCHVCGGELRLVATDLPFKVSENSIVIVKGLPARQCENCQEYLIEDEVMGRVDAILEKAGTGAELEVVRFAA